MPIFSKESIETLRQRIDLADVLSSHIELKRAGAAYKGLCPFHDEKTPSFMIQKGDTHYHCFGCGAHGDAIKFLMTHLKMNFIEAVESLAQRFNVPLQVVESSAESKGPNKAALKEALESACRYYQMSLLHTAEGQIALQYLYKRGIDLNFIHHFRIGFAPKAFGGLRKVLHASFVKDEIMEEAGLILPAREGGWRDFFYDRITFPICDASGHVIGFSARKFKDETFGGKYVNTPETPLFKKSRILFGLNYSRKRIAKERKAIVVEGQIDALRLINEGFNITVAGQGTAFGEGHVKELLNLGISEVYLALDSDEAGRQATCKIGDLFQRQGVEVRVVEMPKGTDPDSFLREKGAQAFLGLMNGSCDYLKFLVETLANKNDIDSPAGKNELVQTLTKQIRSWEHPVMVHESLRRLAHLVRLPEDMIGVGQNQLPSIYIKKSASIGLQSVDSDKVLEGDFVRWLLLAGENQSAFIKIALHNLKPAELVNSALKQIYQACVDCCTEQGKYDLLAILERIEDAEGQQAISDLLQKKVNQDKAEEFLIETIQKIIDRNWILKREELKTRLHSAQHSDDEALELVKAFNALTRPPAVSRE